MSHTECLFLPLATKLRQGNIFTGASNSVHGGGVCGRGMRGRRGHAWQEGMHGTERWNLHFKSEFACQT